MTKRCQPLSGLSVDHWLRRLRSLVLPPTCLLCGDAGWAGLDLCAGCSRDLPYLEGGCIRCALPLPSGSGLVCGRCLRRPPAFDRSIALFPYAEPVRSLLRGLKFRRRLAAGRLLALLMAERLRHEPTLPQLILPVPLHRGRYARRGYNQAQELAEPLARRLGVPLATDRIRRVARTRPQPGLSARQRRANLEGAFRLERPIAARHVAIVDDVMTTGATCEILARLLKKAGIERVDVWVCARALLRDTSPP